ncbi:hypothetical protein BDN72DRAFT_848463 [Pluteus cervinus]|uniref:Uncharacterized protein n=1 Tax=Pluteus cervinus TaxID=181527 RepID=A0ACD3A9T2_9AGAR|nr:hypothetical protein BDN72DRAFT_848463 [Pluteus cervinus]
MPLGSKGDSKYITDSPRNTHISSRNSKFFPRWHGARWTPLCVTSFQMTSHTKFTPHPLSRPQILLAVQVLLLLIKRSDLRLQRSYIMHFTSPKMCARLFSKHSF